MSSWSLARSLAFDACKITIIIIIIIKKWLSSCRFIIKVHLTTKHFFSNPGTCEKGITSFPSNWQNVLSRKIHACSLATDDLHQNSLAKHMKAMPRICLNLKYLSVLALTDDKR